MAGRITLAQSILLSIPNFFMQSLMIPKNVYLEIEKLVRQFIWGCTDDHSKMSLVGWDSICQPCSRGGLGFRHLEDQNNSFLMKIGYSLGSKNNAIWVRVLRSKYCWKESILDSIYKSRSSHLWKALSKLWPLIRDKLIWSLGDGSTVRCWKDKRIPVVWAQLSSGAFSVRSAYWTLKESTWKTLDEQWKAIWNLPGPQRVRVFLWLAVQQRLLINSESVRKGLSACSSCALCGHTTEGLAHVFRDCSFAKNVWMFILPEQLKQRFFSSPFPYWFSLNLSFHERLQDSGLSWPCLFGVVVWRVWKNKNLFIFQNLSWSATEVVWKSSCWARQYGLRMGSTERSSFSSKLVTFSNDSWVSLHTDGAVARNSGYVASGGVARDKEGNWIVRRILILSDNFEVVKTLSDLDLEESEITDHLAKLDLNWKSSLHVFNEAPNEVIDLLKKDKNNSCFM
ncbi:hypothetical protein V6Z11_A13G174800 [Gossypium hirsutum]